MKLTLILTAGLGPVDTTARIDGDTITVDGTAFDLSGVPEGGLATSSGAHPFVGAIRRIGGVIHCAILWTYAPGTAHGEQPPEHPVIEVTEGPVPDPVTRKATA